MNQSLLQTSRTTIVVVLAALAFAGCASGPSIYVDTDPAANFAAYRTYDFVVPLSTDGPGYSSILSQHLRTAAARELEARGYQRSEKPDLLINFNVETKEKIESSGLSSGPGFGGYYGYRSGYYGVWGGYENQISQYTEGTLTVDIVDAARKQLAWDGTVVGRVRDEDRKNLKPAIDKVLTQIFAKYPYRAGP